MGCDCGAGEAGAVVEADDESAGHTALLLERKERWTQCMMLENKVTKGIFVICHKTYRRPR